MSKKIDITKPLRTRTTHDPVVILSDKGPGTFNIVGYIVRANQEHTNIHQWSITGANKEAFASFIENVPEPPKMVPLEAKDFKFGDLIKNSKRLTYCWLAVLGVSNERVITAVAEYPLEHLQRTHEISRDGGKTWQKCEKPENEYRNEGR